MFKKSNKMLCYLIRIHRQLPLFLTGTWGVIRVMKGKLQYTIIEPEKSIHVLDKDHHGVIEPTKLHQVKSLTGDLEFVVEFWRIPGTGVVNEKREGLKE